MTVQGRMVLHVDRNGNEVRTTYNVDLNPVLETEQTETGRTVNPQEVLNMMRQAMSGSGGRRLATRMSTARTGSC